MEIQQIHDRDQLANYFRQDLSTHAYSMGDLDDFYWPQTNFFGEVQGEEVSRVTLLYRGEGLPVLLALGPEGFFGDDYFRFLTNLLPDPFYAHLSPGLEKFFCPAYDLVDYGEHYKMGLVELQVPDDPALEYSVRLTEDDITEMIDLYHQSYPDHAFDPRMVSTGKYFGYRSQGALISVAGVHVYSAKYRVAALGNITTHPDYRNRGFARHNIARLCHDLIDEVDHIAINVKSDNAAAVHLYQSMGFKISSKYGEFGLKKQF